MIFTDENGKQWEWITYGRPYPPAPKQHTFGGVVFEETGPAQVIEAGEWYLRHAGDYAAWAERRTEQALIPLRPVRVEEE